jgi:hypothetical protein
VYQIGFGAEHPDRSLSGFRLFISAPLEYLLTENQIELMVISSTAGSRERTEPKMKSATKTEKKAVKSPFPCYCCDGRAVGTAVAYNRQGRMVVKMACSRHAWSERDWAGLGL